MTDGAAQAPAGWYDDPYAPGRMRYFDGEVWTSHFHTPGKLPDIGSWFSTTFSVFRDHWQGAAAIAVASALVGNIAIWGGFRALVQDAAVIDEELVNFGADRFVMAGVLVLVAWFAQMMGWLTLNRYLQRAHYQATPSVGEALARALRRLPRYLALVLTLLLAMVVLFALVIAIAFASPVLAVLIGLALLVGAVWAFVKLSFVNAAVVAAPNDAPILASSAEVSSGRFWPVFGRVLLVVVGLAIVGNIVASVTGAFASPIDQDALADVVQTGGNEVRVRDFTFAELLPSTAEWVGFVIISTVIRAASSLISTSALMRLYLDSGAPSDISSL